jgi:hypothetical protein
MDVPKRSLELTGRFWVLFLMRAASCLNSMVIFAGTGLLFSPNLDSDQYQSERFALLMQQIKNKLGWNKNRENRCL